MNYEFSVLEKKLKSLPPDIQQLLTSVEMAEKLKQISDKHGLMLDQTSALSDITSYTMLGLLPSKDFVENVSKEVGINEEKSSALASDISKEIFGSIRESLIRIQEGGPAEQMESEVKKPGTNETTDLDREEILKEIEHPEQYAFVDHLLTNPSGGQTETKNVVVESKQAPQPKRYPVDPYREQV